MRNFFLCLLLGLFACIPVQAGERDPVIWQTLFDSSHTYNLEKIRTFPPLRWERESSAMIAKGFSSDNLWLTASLQATGAGDYVLEFANPMLDKMVLYIERANKRVEVQQGGFVQTHSGDWWGRYHNEVFNIELAAGEKVNVFVQAEATRALILWPRFTTAADFFQQGMVERFWLGLFAGLFLVLSVYFLMVWRATHDRGFLEYVAFLTCNGLLQIHMLGLLHEFFLYPYPRINDLCNALLPSLVFVTFIRFTRYFLEIDTYSPRSWRLLRICSWLSLSLLPVYLLFGSRISIPMAYALGPVVVLAGLSAGFIAWSRGYRPARFYLLAQATLGVGGLTFTLIRFNLMPAVPLTIYSFQFSSALEVIITALALADKINILQLDRLKAQSERWATERKMVEVLRESEALLEHRVKDRTLQLEDALRLQCQQGEVLVQANQQLIGLKEESSAFLGIAAHDLKNPTAAIMSYVDLILDRWHVWDDEKKKKRLVSIRELAQLIHEIIRNLLDVNAIESGSYTLHPGRLDPAAVCQKLIEEYRDRVEAKNITLHLESPEGLQVNADPSALHQVLDNLLSNAIKYSPQGRNVYLSVVAEDENILIRIRDEGPGISQEDQTKLYRKFTRLSARPTGGEHSTGLGLSIVKRIIEASGGAVKCESRLGEGATFIVSLPALPPVDRSQYGTPS